MGVGKTNHLMQYICDNIAVYIYVSFRVSLTEEIVKRMNEKNITTVNYRSDSLSKTDLDQLMYDTYKNN